MKKRIKEKAIDLFYKKGYFATSMSNIALGSGIQKASIYHHYSRKEDILFDILITTLDDLIEYLDDSLYGVKEVENRLRVAIRSHIKFHCDRQKEVLIADSELRGLTAKNYKSIVARRDAYEAKFQEIIQEGIHQGIFLETDVKVISYAVLTMCTTVATWFNPSGRLPKEDIMHIYEEFVLNGLKVERGRRENGQ
ncbi:MAG: TetR/AcrR family transcriptional regulator [Thermodesulfobacteriota bacterium]